MPQRLREGNDGSGTVGSTRRAVGAGRQHHYCGVAGARLPGESASGGAHHLVTGGSATCRSSAMAEKKPRILVVFFSRTGVTKQLAQAIARAEQGDLEELREARSRRGLVGWLRSGYEGSRRLAATTLPLQHRLQDYDLVFVGSPTWSRSLSSPVRGFLQSHASELKSVAIFATCAGHGAEDVLNQMAAMLTAAPLARLPLLEQTARHSPAVWAAEFAESAIAAWESRRTNADDVQSATHALGDGARVAATARRASSN